MLSLCSSGFAPVVTCTKAGVGMAGMSSAATLAFPFVRGCMSPEPCPNPAAGYPHGLRWTATAYVYDRTVLKLD